MSVRRLDTISFFLFVLVQFAVLRSEMTLLIAEVLSVSRTDGESVLCIVRNRMCRSAAVKQATANKTQLCCPGCILGDQTRRFPSKCRRKRMKKSHIPKITEKTR